MISVLFVQKNSVYKTMTDSGGEPLDCWDLDRDGRKWPGGNALIAHPPCRLFSRLAHLSTAPESEKELAYFAVEAVRIWGGVLEHPALSALWRDRSLPAPGKRDNYGFSFCLDQFWFGYIGQKKTWLYICGMTPKELPPYSLRFGHPVDVFSGGGREYVKGSRHGGIRSATPPAFARWLVGTAEKCHGDKRVQLQ